MKIRTCGRTNRGAWLASMTFIASTVFMAGTIAGIASETSARALAPVAVEGAWTTQPTETSAPKAGGREVDLRPKFKAGEELTYVMTLQNDGSMEMPPLDPSKQTSRQTVEFRLKTISTDPEKGSTVELIYDAIKIQLEAGEAKVDYDSRSPANAKAPPASPRRTTGPGQPAKGKAPAPAEDDPEADAGAAMIEALRPLVGSTMTLSIAPDGTITSVTGGGELSGALMKQYGGPIADPQGVKDLFGPIFSVRSAKATARVGEKWQYIDKLDLPLLGKLRLTTDHALKSFSGSKATIDFRGTIDLDTENGEPVQPLKLTDTRYEGSYIWDTERGTLEAMEQVQAFTLSGDTQGMGLKVRNNGTVKIERQRR